MAERGYFLSLAQMEKTGLCWQEFSLKGSKPCGFPDCDCWEVKAARKVEELKAMIEVK